jgi:hypothetical protein
LKLIALKNDLTASEKVIGQNIRLDNLNSTQVIIRKYDGGSGSKSRFTREEIAGFWWICFSPYY